MLETPAWQPAHVPAHIPAQFNLASYFLDHNLEAGRADKVALYCHDRTLTYAQIHQQSCSFARLLGAADVGMEDRVLMVLPNIPEFAPVWFGILRQGAVVTMVNPLLPSEEYEYYLEYTRAKVVVTDLEGLKRLEPVLPTAHFLKAVVVVGLQDEQIVSEKALLPYELVFSIPPLHFVADTSRDDIAIWLFTSGSTGKPKAAVHMHHDFAWNTERYAKGVLGIRETDLTLGVPKLFFGYATGTDLMFPFAVGASTVIFPERSTADVLYSHIARFRPTILTSVPTMINAMLQHPMAESADLSCLRMVLSAGEALPPELYHRWMARFPVEILDGIGSAEMFHIYISNAPGAVKPGSLGKLVPGYEARVVGPDGQEVPEGEAGVLHIKGDSAALCYWRDHEKSKETFAGDWCFTKDLFRRDAEGYFWYEGRTDDMLKVSGIWVSPLEIENSLLQHDQVLEACVVGYEDEHGLVKAMAWLVMKDQVPDDTTRPQLEESLKHFLKQRLAPHKYPRSWRFVESLPKNDRGKVDRKTIRSWQ